MIAQLIEILNVAAETLPVDTRYGWAQIVSGQPAVHIGAGQWVPLANDLNGTWSYVRINGQTRVEPIDIGDPCSGARVRLPFRLVALLDRSACEELPGLLTQTAGSIRKARKQFVTVSGAYRVGFSTILWQIDDFASQEFQPLPNIPSDRVLVAIDVVMEVDAREECFQGCGELTDVVCAIIAKASNAKVVECLGPERVAQICDLPPCPPTTVNGTESNTPTITVLQGGNPVGTLNPATGVVTIEECPEGCTEPYTIKWDVDGTIIDILVDADPCGGEAVLSCDTLIDAVVVEGAGTEDANGIYLRDGEFNELPRYVKETFEIYSVNPSPDYNWQIDNTDPIDGLYSDLQPFTHDRPWDTTFEESNGASPPPTVRQATIGDLCCTGGPAEPCPIFFRLADEADNTLETGIVPDACANPNLEVIAPNATVQLRDSAGSNLGSPVSYLSGSTNNLTAPDGTIQRVDSIGGNIGASFAIKSGEGLGVVCPDGSVQLRDTAGNNIGSPVAVRSNQTGVIVTAPDANIEVNGTPEDAVLSGGTLDILLSDGTDPVVPVSVTPGSGTLTIVVPAGSTCDRAITATWGAYNDETTPVVLPAEYQGITYDFVSQTGTNGTITVSVDNGASFAAPPFTVGTAAVIFRRTTFTAAGSALYEE